MTFSAPHDVVRDCVARALGEDLDAVGDLTAALLDQEALGELVIRSREVGVIAGQACVVETFAQLDASVVVDVVSDDGSRVEPGQVITRISGRLCVILTGERTALNFLGHLSGVASATAAMVEIVRAVAPETKVLDTRKTTPGLRVLEKAAVRAGGGTHHRMNLSDALLIKDNPLGFLSIAEAVERAQTLWPGKAIEVEVEDLAQLTEAAHAGATSVLLDNMSPDQAKEATVLARSLNPGLLVEVSGGITLENAAAYAAAGVDLISSGALTHSIKNLDLGLDVLGPESAKGR